MSNSIKTNPFSSKETQPLSSQKTPQLSSKKTLFQRLLTSKPFEAFPNRISSPLFENLQSKILEYQSFQGFNLSKTYSNFLQIGNSPSTSNKTFKNCDFPVKNEENGNIDHMRINSQNLTKNSNFSRNHHGSICLNDTKIMKKSYKYLKEYNKSISIAGDKEKAEGTLKRNFSLARIIIEEISHLYQDSMILEQKFHEKCEILKEKL